MLKHAPRQRVPQLTADVIRTKRKTRSTEVGNISRGMVVGVSAALGRHSRSEATVAAVQARAVCLWAVNLQGASCANRDEPKNAQGRCITSRSTRRSRMSRRVLSHASRHAVRGLALRWTDKA